MFNYSPKTKAISAGILLVLIMGIVWLVNYNYSRSQDLVMTANVRSLASALETYYSQFRLYPKFEATALSNLNLLTDQGFNNNGQTIYWQSSGTWWRDGVYQSDGENYIIQFELKHAWDALGLKKGGGTCQLSTGMILRCQSQ